MDIHLLLNPTESNPANQIRFLLHEINDGLQQLTDPRLVQYFKTQMQLLLTRYHYDDITSLYNSIAAYDVNLQTSLIQLRNGIRIAIDNICTNLILSIIGEWREPQIISKYTNSVFTNVYCKRIPLSHTITFYKSNLQLQQNCAKRLLVQLESILKCFRNVRQAIASQTFLQKLTNASEFDKRRLQTLIVYIKANILAKLTLFIKAVLLAQIARMKDNPARNAVTTTFFNMNNIIVNDHVLVYWITQIFSVVPIRSVNVPIQLVDVPIRSVDVPITRRNVTVNQTATNIYFNNEQINTTARNLANHLYTNL